MAEPVTASLYDLEEGLEPPAANGKPEADPLICPDCGFVAKRTASLGVHRRFKHRGAGEPATDRPTEKKPKAKTPARVSIAELSTGVWQGLGWLTARTEKMAASRMFGLTAPAMGPVADKALKGTLLDKALQPIARMGTSGKEAATLVAAPFTAQAFLDNPNAFTQAAFVSNLEAVLPQIVKTFKDAKRRQERMEADLEDLAEVFGKQPGERVTTQEVAFWILTGSTETPPQSETEPEAATEPEVMAS